MHAERPRPERVTAGAGLLSFVLHLDKHLSEIIARHGAATYGILFAIVFAETGFVLTPFLPGFENFPLRQHRPAEVAVPSVAKGVLTGC